MYYYKDTKDGFYVSEVRPSVLQGWSEISEAQYNRSNPQESSEELRRRNLAPLSAWQVRKVLNIYSLREIVESTIASAPIDVRDAWEFANEFTRDNALLNNMATALGMTDAQLDNLFTVGITL